jgi:hypothetical protein
MIRVSLHPVFVVSQLLLFASACVIGDDLAPPLAALDIIETSPAAVLDFGDASLGSSRVKTLEIRNPSLKPLHSLDVVIENPDDAPFTLLETTCSTLIAPEDACVVNVAFDAVTEGDYAASLIVTYGDENQEGTVNLALHARTVQTGSLEFLLGDVLDLGKRAYLSDAVQSLPIRNAGQFKLTNLVAKSSSSLFTISSGTCLNGLGRGNSCSFSVNFAADAKGDQEAAVEISYNDGTKDTKAIATLRAEVVDPAVVVFDSNEPLEFGLVMPGTRQEKTLTLTNLGGVTAETFSIIKLDAPFAFAGDEYPGTGGTCGEQLAPSASCTLVIECAPLLPGAVESDFVLRYVDGLEAQDIARQLRCQ